jgi:hypothetical protein
MRRIVVLSMLVTMLAACGGIASSPAASPTGVATPPPTAAATLAAVLTNPPPTPIPGCLPTCWFGKLTRPGAISGPYTTKYFFGGRMTLDVPNQWWGYEDSTGELALGRPNDENARLEFWLDLEAAKDPSGVPDPSVERTGDALLAWFLDKEIIHLIERKSVVVGGLPFESIEYSRNDKAPTEDPGCPAEIQPCSVAFVYPEWDGVFGEGSHFHSKLLVANAMWGGERHSIYVSFAAIDPDYDDLIETVDAVIASVQWPAGVVSP